MSAPPQIAQTSGVVRSTLIVSITRVLGALLALGLGVLSARYFGTSSEKDCYVIAQTVPTIVSTLLVGGIYSTLLVTLAEIGLRGGVLGQIAFIKRTVRHLTVVAVPLTLLAVACAPILVRSIAPGFEEAKIELSARLLRITAFGALGSVYFSVLKCLFETRGRFGASSSMHLLIVLVSIGTLVLLVNRIGIFTLAVGPVLGILTALLCLAWLASRTLKDPPGFRPNPVAPASREQQHRRFWTAFVPVCLGASFGQVNLLVDNAFASYLPTGSITMLGFAFVIISNAELLTTFSLAEVAFPRLAASAFSSTMELARTFRASLRYMVLLTAPLSVGALTFGLPLARLLYERGRFGPESTRGVALLLACYAPELLFMGYLVLFSRVLFARRRLNLVAWTSLGSMLANAILDALLMQPFGANGIALATTGVTFLHLMSLIPLVRREVPGILGSGDFQFTVKVVVSAALMGIVVLAWASAFEHWFDIASELSRLVEVVLGLALATGMYVLALHVLRVDEARMVLRTFLGPVLSLAQGRSPW